MRYTMPEWFVGGPLHGQDRRDVCPEASVYQLITNKGTIYDIEDSVQNTEEIWTYTRYKYAIGDHVLSFWADKGKISHELVACKLAELIFAPHKRVVMEKGNENDVQVP